LAINDTCIVNADCAIPELCELTGNSAGSVCANPIVQLARTFTCTVNADCGTGDVCNAGTCVAGINALSFSGTGQVIVPNSTALNLGTAATVEAWFYLTSFGGEMILNKWTQGSEDKFLGFADATQEPPSCWFWYPGIFSPSFSDGEGASTIPAIQSWHHIAATLGNGTLTLFVDGVATGSGAYGASIGNSTGSLNIGGLIRDGSWHPPINGYIGDVRISSTDKYPTNFTPASTLTTQSDTLALWHLNEGTGTVANDSGPNSLIGSVQGTTQWVLAPPRP
jgi:hypothetical protein